MGTIAAGQSNQDDEGVINTYVVRSDGTLGRHRMFNAMGQGAFGFTFRKDGTLITTEQFDGPDGPGQGAAGELPESVLAVS